MEGSLSFPPPLARFVELFFHGFLQWVLRLQNVYCPVLSSSMCLQFKLASFVALPRRQSKKSTARSGNDDDGDVKVIRSRDVEVVMAKMGLFWEGDGEKLKESLGSDEVRGLSEEEPSLGEVKDGFNDFDDNRDGFIDASELQTLLCNLVFRAALHLHECQRMIRAYSTDGDDRIDFNDFVIVMENSFC